MFLKNLMQEPNKEIKHCKECGQEISPGAKKCHHCTSYQSFNWFHFFQSLSSATAFILVIISSVSLTQTCSERKNAEVAVIAAKKAQKEAESAKAAAIKHAQELVNSLERKTDNALSRIELASELADLLTDASSNYVSLMKLERISEHDGYPYRDLHIRAKEAVEKIRAGIIREYNVYFELPYAAMVKANNTFFYYFDTKNWVFKKFLEKYAYLTEDIRALYIQFVCNKKDRLNKKERFTFLYEVLLTEKLPMAIYMACSIVDEEAQLKLDYLSDKTKYLGWLKSKI